MIDRYLERAADHARNRDAELARSVWISRARLTVFLLLATAVVWALARGIGPAGLALMAALVAAFTALVVWHARVEERAAWHDALYTVALRSVARIERRWNDLPTGEAPPGVDVSHHPYAQDLDLFGRASLYQWLGTTMPRGAYTVATWLLRAPDLTTVRGRQEAVLELAGMDDWREALAAHGELARSARQAEIDVLLTWAEAAPLRLTTEYLFVVGLTGAIWILFALFLLGLIDAALWLIPLVAGIVLSFARAARTYRAFDGAGAGQQALQRYAALVEHATGTPFSSPALRSLHDRLCAAGKGAPMYMRRLNRILGFAELHSGAALLHFPIQAFTLWDFHVLFALERWRLAAGLHVRDWLDALGEMDALSTFAAVTRDNPAWTMPLLHDRPVIEAVMMGHPLIGEGRRIANDVRVGPPGTVLLVTGSNMSGKSTLLRAIGLNSVLAHAGSSVCASELRMPMCDLQTSIRVQDSLELGLSYFMAALARLKGVVDAAEHPRHGRVLLYLLDEILQGTNSAERGIAVRAVARHLLDAGAIGVLTTHDLSLAGEEPLASSAVLVHFSETVDEHGAMKFDYRLREGLATSRNALRLMQMIGIDPKRP